MALGTASSAQPPWQRIAERVDCIRNDPSCRQGLVVHAVILGLVLILAVFRKFLVAQGITAQALEKKRQLAAAEPSALTSVAEVDSIIVYPVKSCAGVRLDSAQITRKGLELDRRWMVIKRNKADDEWQKIDLREEAKLTLVQPEIESDGLKLSLSSLAKVSRDAFPVIKIPLSCNSLATRINVPMWGDTADAYIVDEVVSSEAGRSYSGTPSQWLSLFLGYEVKLVQFDPEGVHRDAFPFFRPPVLAKGVILEELKKPRGIEFQDEYPLLVATVESLKDLQEQIRAASFATDGSDGRGGKAIGGKLFKAELWKEKILQFSQEVSKAIDDEADLTSEQRQTWLNIQRFRPNIVLRSSRSHDKPTIKAWEEDCWTKLQFGRAGDDDQASDPTATQVDVGVQMHVVSRCERCLLTSVDPVTADRDVSVPLAFLRRNNSRVKEVPLDEHGVPKGGDDKGKAGPCFGMYAVVPESGQGKLAVGDSVTCFWSSDGNK
ncbi:unnamed protein product [Parajaminaea phylloscopi]